jgi:hypothetical protein
MEGYILTVTYRLYCCSIRSTHTAALDAVHDEWSKNSPSVNQKTADDDAPAPEQVLDQAISLVVEDLEDVETKELQVDKTKILEALDQVVLRVRDDMLAFLNGRLSQAEVNTLLAETESHLRTHVTDAMTSAAKKAVDEVVQEVEGLVDGEMEDGDAAKDIDKDLHEHEGQALEDLRSSIRTAETDIEKGLYSFALGVEKDILELRLSEVIGESVTFVIQDNKLVDPKHFLEKLAITADRKKADEDAETDADSATSSSKADDLKSTKKSGDTGDKEEKHGDAKKEVTATEETRTSTKTEDAEGNDVKTAESTPERTNESAAMEDEEDKHDDKRVDTTTASDTGSGQDTLAEEGGRGLRRYLRASPTTRLL